MQKSSLSSFRRVPENCDTYIALGHIIRILEETLTRLNIRLSCLGPEINLRRIGRLIFSFPDTIALALQSLAVAA